MSVAPNVEKGMIRSDLGPLTTSNIFKIKQRVDIGEAVVQNFLPCLENANIYEVWQGNKMVYLVKEDSSMCCRICCSPIHSADMKFYKPEETNRVEFVAQKPFRFFRTCNIIPVCCGGTIIPVVNGKELGMTSERACSGCSPSFDMGSDGMTLEGGGCCIDSPCIQDQVPFVVSRNGKRLAEIKKEMGTDVRTALFTDATNIKLKFEKAASETDRVRVMSSVLLLDYMFFEETASSMNECYLGTCYCFGCVIPCKLSGGNGGGNGGAHTGVRTASKYSY